MRFYTYQPINFDITKEISDLSKSENYQLFKKGYDWLFSQLGTNQVIWSLLGWYENGKDYLRFGPQHAQITVLWELEVPQSEIIGCIDSDPWHSIISDHHFISDQLYEQWEKESQGNEDIFDQKWDQFCEEIKKEETWQEALVPFALDKHLDILLPSPIKEEWVIRKSLISGYELDLFYFFNDPDFGEIEMPFENQLEAIPFLGAIKTALRKQKKQFNLESRFAQNRYRVKFINEAILKITK